MTAVPPHQADQAPTVQFAVPGQSTPPAAAQPAAQPAAPPAAEPAAGGRTRRTRLLIVGAVVVALVAAGGGWVWAAAGDVPRGTTVLGVELGALSKAAARTALTNGLGARTSAPVPLTLAGQSIALAPGEAGLVLDVGATVERAADGLPKPWGTREVDPVVTLDEAKLDNVLRKSVDPKQVTMTMPGIRYDRLTPKPTYPAPGQDLDPARAAALIKAGWLRSATIDIPLVQRTPASTREQVDQLVTTLAAPAVAAPVTVGTERGTFVLTPDAIAAALTFRADDAGTLAPAVDEKKLRAAAAKELAKVEVKPEEASISLNGDTPRIAASTPGKSVDLAKLGTDLLAVLPNPAPRQATATLVEAAAKTTDADLAALGVKEKVSTFTTKFTGGLGSPRSQNIVTIAKEVDGALVKPGETFSLNGHTGIRSYPQGYQDAPVIIGGVLEPGVGGGASQFTTTLFNAAYYAGLEDVEHKPHSFYFSRYPEVIESTIFYPNLDLKFKNTTPYGILIDTSHTKDSVTVAMWSTKFYDSVKSEKGPRRNITSPRTQERPAGPKCIATDGLPGFTMDVWRVIRKDGQEVKREKFSWKYAPEPRFVCT